jgi:hypothetical protein
MQEDATSPQDESTLGMDSKSLANCGNFTCSGSQNLCCFSTSLQELRCTGSSVTCETSLDCAEALNPNFGCQARYCVPSSQWTNCSAI